MAVAVAVVVVVVVDVVAVVVVVSVVFGGRWLALFFCFLDFFLVILFFYSGLEKGRRVNVEALFFAVFSFFCFAANKKNKKKKKKKDQVDPP